MLSLAKRIRETVTPARKTSAFLTQGVLTPEEFVEAGEQLVFKCPTWTWESGDPSKAKDCLPDKSKQFLVTRNVPCHRRAKALEGEYVGDTEVMFGDGGDDDGSGGGATTSTGGRVLAVACIKREQGFKYWTLSAQMDLRPQLAGREAYLHRPTVHQSLCNQTGLCPSALALNEGGGVHRYGVAAGLGAIQLVESHFTSPPQVLMFPPVRLPATSPSSARDLSNLIMAIAYRQRSGVVSGNVSERERVVVSDEGPLYVEDNLMQGDEATVQSGGAYLTAQEPDDPILPTRTYDLSITYDKHHQTPRMFLFGYDESGQPLSAEEVFEDVMQDYARQTVTMEPHPHLSSHHASVHPCKHASTMKIMLENLTRGGKEARVDQYLFIFLKFIQSVVPTIDYDYTMSVDAGGGNGAAAGSADDFVDIAEPSP
ncbi:unnamed protein product [Scytosiphon promiscuus]